MNTLVIYFSKFGNTRLVADSIHEVLRSLGSVRLLGMDQLIASDLDGIDVIVAGTPTHNMNLPKEVRDFLDTLPRGTLRGTLIAAFDTSYRMSPFLARFTAAKKLARKLRGRRLVPPETFHVEGREGPLYAGELDRARDWAVGIMERARHLGIAPVSALP